MAIKSYRDLIVWQRAIELVEAVYRTARCLPAGERFGLVSQIQRAAVSIPANIAEGYGRSHRKEYLRHLSFAMGSLSELETHLVIIQRLGLLEPKEIVAAWDLSQEVGKMLNRLMTQLRSTAKRTETYPLNPNP